jgi:SNF2 family DNA or RNA helicase
MRRAVAVKPVRREGSNGSEDMSKIHKITDHVYSGPASAPFLTDHYNEVDTPLNFKGGLFPHQKTVVQGLLDLEDSRMLKIDGNEVASNAIVLSEPLGSGKTIELLAMIMLRPKPKAYPYYTSSFHKYSEWDDVVFKTKHTGQVLLKPTVVVVGSSVLRQWEDAVKAFTNMKCLVVGDQYGMNKFKALIDSDQINSYDIILIKNGTLSWNGKLMPMTNVFTEVIGTRCMARAIYDDFDTIKLPIGSRAISALSSIYVTATSNDTSKESYSKVNLSMLDMLRQMYHIDLNTVMKDTKLFTYFNVRNNANYVRDSTAIPKINVFKYTYKNPDDKFLALMDIMDDKQANQVMEMINGDAVNTAADAIGISSTSVADIFQRILGNKHRDYTAAVKQIKYIKSTIVDIDSLDEHEEGKELSASAYDSFKGRANKCIAHGLEYRSQMAIDYLNERKIEAEKTRDEAGLALDRVMSNLKEGNCQICNIELADTDVFIVKCCGIILCDVCCFKGCQIKKKYDPLAKMEHLHGSCANCKHVVLPHQDLIFVDKKFDIASLDEETMVSEHTAAVEAQKEETAAALDIPVEQVEEPINPKLQALWDIINGKKSSECEDIPCAIKHLIEGSRDVTGDAPIKVLLFANYAETLGNCSKFLGERGIEFLRIQGTYGQKADIVNEFKSNSNVKVLLINASDSCAGLNLAFATDLVYFHKIQNPDIEAQVAGRIQRIGRQQNARIHYLTYTNEKAI